MNTKVTTVSNVPVEKNNADQPLFSSNTAAGFGIPGDDTIDDTLNLQDLLVKNPSATFFVRVTGDSMEGAKIFDGDVLVVDRSVTPADGMIVVAAVNGELLVKKLKKGFSGFSLVSENSQYSPISLGDSDECFIWGVVVGTARKFR